MENRQTDDKNNRGVTKEGGRPNRPKSRNQESER